jgi:hypothetical protein
LKTRANFDDFNLFTHAKGLSGMKDMEKFLKSVAQGLRIMASAVDYLSERIDSFTPAEPEADPCASSEAPEVSEIKRPEESAPKKPKASKDKRAKGPTEKVLAVIQMSKDGVDSVAVQKKTKLSSKQIHNIVYRLKKQGRIVSEEKGVYKLP